MCNCYYNNAPHCRLETISTRESLRSSTVTRYRNVFGARARLVRRIVSLRSVRQEEARHIPHACSVALLIRLPYCYYSQYVCECVCACVCLLLCGMLTPCWWKSANDSLDAAQKSVFDRRVRWSLFSLPLAATWLERPRPRITRASLLVGLCLVVGVCVCANYREDSSAKDGARWHDEWSVKMVLFCCWVMDSTPCHYHARSGCCGDDEDRHSVLPPYAKWQRGRWRNLKPYGIDPERGEKKASEKHCKC